MGSAYLKYQSDNGSFIALDLGAGRLKNEIQFANKTTFDRNIVQTGVTAGHSFKAGQFEVKPVLGVRYSRLSAVNYELEQAKVYVPTTHLASAFAGVEAGYQLDFGDFSIKPLFSAKYTKNSGTEKLYVNNYQFDYEADDRQRYSAGLELKYKLATLNVKGGVTKGKQMGSQRFAGVSLNLSF